jgi:hypothetical protein
VLAARIAVISLRRGLTTLSAIGSLGVSVPRIGPIDGTTRAPDAAFSPRRPWKYASRVTVKWSDDAKRISSMNASGRRSSTDE